MINRFYIALFAGLCAFAVFLAAVPHVYAQDDEVGQLKKLYVRSRDIPYPADNPYSREKEELGKVLFFDPRLSGSGMQSCATCHNPAFSWEDGMSTGTGHEHKKLKRATPGIANLAWDELFFWDGRALSLEEQAHMPIESEQEMHMDLQTMLGILDHIPEYHPLFEKAFPDDPKALSIENSMKAIATYERGILTADAPFDQWVQGDEKAISESAKRGFLLFNKKANCAACHAGPNFSDGSFHDTGLPDDDIGRGEFLPQLTSMQHAFKTVGLRNIDRRAPYMHDGSLPTLEAVIDHYDHGFTKRESLSEEIRPLSLTAEEKADLVAFLKSLNSVDEPVTIPLLPR